MNWWSRIFCGVDKGAIKQPVSRPRAVQQPGSQHREKSVSEKLFNGRAWLVNQAEYDRANQSRRHASSQLKQKSLSVNDIQAVAAFYGRLPRWKGQVAALIKKSGSDCAQRRYLKAIQDTLNGMDKSQDGLADIRGTIENAFKQDYSTQSPELGGNMSSDLKRVEKLRAIKALVDTMHDAGSVLARGENSARRFTK